MVVPTTCTYHLSLSRTHLCIVTNPLHLTAPAWTLNHRPRLLKGTGRDRGHHHSGNRGSLCDDRSRNRTLSAQATSSWPRETAPTTPYAVPESGMNSGNPHSMVQMGGAPLSAPVSKHLHTRAAVRRCAGRPRESSYWHDRTKDPPRSSPPLARGSRLPRAYLRHPLCHR